MRNHRLNATVDFSLNICCVIIFFDYLDLYVFETEMVPHVSELLKMCKQGVQLSRDDKRRITSRTHN